MTAEASVPYVCMSYVLVSPCPQVPITSPRPHVPTSPVPHVLISLSPCGSTFLMSAFSHSSRPHNLHISIFFMSPCPSRPRVPVFPCLHIPMSPCPHAPYLHILHVSMSHIPIFPCHVPVSSCPYVFRFPCPLVLTSPCLHDLHSPCSRVPKCPYPHVLYVLSCRHVCMSPYPSCPQVPHPHVLIPPRRLLLSPHPHVSHKPAQSRVCLMLCAW